MQIMQKEGTGPVREQEKAVEKKEEGRNQVRNGLETVYLCMRVSKWAAFF